MATASTLVNRHPFSDPTVAAVFRHYPKDVLPPLLELRELIFEVAESLKLTDLKETLKWGQPSYLTKKGTTIRIDQIENSKGAFGLYFHCRTGLIDSFRQQHPNAFDYQGKRCILFKDSKLTNKALLSGFIEQALTYHGRP